MQNPRTHQSVTLGKAGALLEFVWLISKVVIEASFEADWQVKIDKPKMTNRNLMTIARLADSIKNPQ
jgi:hypothetical protein